MTIIYILLGVILLIALVFLAFAAHVKKIYDEIDLEFDSHINGHLCDYDDHIWTDSSLGNTRICLRCGIEQKKM